METALEQLGDLLAQNAALAETVALAGSDRLVATFRAKYTSCKTFCERPEQLARLENTLAAVAGKPVRLEFAVTADEPSAAPPPRHGANDRQRMVERTEHPMVRRAGELFDARLTRIEESQS